MNDGNLVGDNTYRRHFYMLRSAATKLCFKQLGTTNQVYSDDDVIEAVRLILLNAMRVRSKIFNRFEGDMKLDAQIYLHDLVENRNNPIVSVGKNGVVFPSKFQAPVSS